jgi:hypothetical protein
MIRTVALALGASLVSLSALAQPATAPGAVPGQTGEAVVQGQPNTTGNDPSVSVSRGATGAETATTDSAAGGNANKPEQAVPNGSSR